MLKDSYSVLCCHWLIDLKNVEISILSSYMRRNARKVPDGLDQERTKWSNCGLSSKTQDY